MIEYYLFGLITGFILGMLLILKIINYIDGE